MSKERIGQWTMVIFIPLVMGLCVLIPMFGIHGYAYDHHPEWVQPMYNLLCREGEEAKFSKIVSYPEPGKTVTSTDVACIGVNGAERDIGVLAFLLEGVVGLVLAMILAAVITAPFVGLMIGVNGFQRSRVEHPVPSDVLPQLVELLESRDTGEISEAEYQRRRNEIMRAVK